MMHITEDTPPDMLTGAMDLTVHLPSQGKTVKMSVERSTPMMDVLVLITTQYNLQVSRYAIEALGMAPSLDYSDKVLPYRPNTPLGALDTQHIRVIPKMKAAPPPRPVKVAGHQPFESTFRLKVHLPKNQLYVIRISRNIYLEEIMTKVCDDKNMDPRKYEFRHPGNLDQILDSKLTISDYQITEIYLVVKGTLTAFSTNDIMALRREEEKKQMHTKAGGGVFNLIFKKGRNSLEYGSVSSENRSVSPSHSDDSRSVTPPAIQTPIITTLIKPKDQPKPPQRKRKPAPKPPTQPDQPEAQPLTLTINQQPIIKPSSSTEAIVDAAVPNILPIINSATNICHSRTSSDSSGYHEASILSDNLINNSSLPRILRRPKTIIGVQEVEMRKGNIGALRGDHSKSTGNLATLSSKSTSTMSLITTGRKKKAAPLPPTPAPSLTPSQEQPLPTSSNLTAPTSEEITLVDQANAEESLSNAATSVPTPASLQKSLDIVENHQITSSEFVDHVFNSINRSNISSLNTYIDPTKQSQSKKVDKPGEIQSSNNEIVKDTTAKETEPVLEWKYELPLPPTAFRDNGQDNFDNLTHYDTTTLISERFRGDSVVSNPELFEKLNKLKETQTNLSDTTTTASVVSTEDDNKSIYNKLSLELLQKRKSLVYNREIATTLKSPEVPIRDTFKNELEDAILLQTKSNKTITKPMQSQKSQSGGLPNFKITTYDEPKSKINIYEDDTISSNQSTKMSNDVITYKTRSLMRNQQNDSVTATATKSYSPVVRSGSFSINTWSAVNPLKRSTSQAALIHKRNEEELAKETKVMSKAISTMDISGDNAGGLQSIGVMKLIRSSLESPISIDTVDSHVNHNEPEIRRNSLQKTTITSTLPTTFNSNTLPSPANKETKPLKRWSPPAISLGTWSDRPKSEVIVKRDSDYKLKPFIQNNSYKSGGLVVISNNNNNNEMHQRNYDDQAFVSRKVTSNHQNNNVSIKINGSEPISSSSETGNVTIRIGSASTNQNNNNNNNINSQPVTYRKPFGNINSIRPHSIAIDGNYDDISRRPVVTSATLKKSITQINTSLNNNNNNNNKSERPSSVFLVNNSQTNNYSINNNNRKSWKALLNQGTFLNSSKSTNAVDSSYNTNVNVPFSQMRLKRTDSSKILTEPTSNGTEMGFGRVLEKVANKRQLNLTATPYCPPPPPPQMPIINKASPRQQNTISGEDPRSALLSAIQNFGGKKGLRTIRT